MARRRLSDRIVKSLGPAPEGKRYDIMDAEAPGLGVRVTDNGHVSFIYAGRFPGSKNYTRREIDDAATLDEAREVARRWRAMIRAGVDPLQVKRKEQEAAMRSQATTFGAVAGEWFKEKLATERNGKDVEREFRNNLLPRWVDRPIAEITDLEVLTIIRAKKQTAPSAARNLLGNLRRFFSWTIDQRCYGIATSPCDRLKPTKIIGKKKKGQRILSEEELFALWRAARREVFPFNAFYQILILTAVRLNEAAGVKKTEVEFAARLWTIPAERMKGAEGEARPHVVPLTADIHAVFAALPEFKQGPYLFTTTSGKNLFALAGWLRGGSITACCSRCARSRASVVSIPPRLYCRAGRTTTSDERSGAISPG